MSSRPHRGGLLSPAGDTESSQPAGTEPWGQPGHLKVSMPRKKGQGLSCTQAFPPALLGCPSQLPGPLTFVWESVCLFSQCWGSLWRSS